MPNTNPSANMSLPVPVVGTDPGPQYATDVNSCLTIIDAHNHSAGSGVQITPDGINITADLPFNGYNLTTVKSMRMDPQSVVLSGPSDIGCLYEVGVDLYYNDGNGNQIQITSGGAVAGTPGSISNLVSPASASFVSGNGTFVFESGANIPGNIDGASIIIREQTTGPNGITLASPLSLAADYTVTFPGALPGAQNIVTLDSSGNLAANWNVDNSTLEVNSNQLRIKNSGVTNAKMASNSVDTAQIVALAVTPPKMGAANVQTGVNVNSDTTTTTYKDAAPAVSITTYGRPVMLMPVWYNNGNDCFVTSALGFSSYRWLRDATVICEAWFGGTTDNLRWPLGAFAFIDATPAAGTYSYVLQFKSISGSSTSWQTFSLRAWEI